MAVVPQISPHGCAVVLSLPGAPKRILSLLGCLVCTTRPQFLSHTQTTWVLQPVVLKARRNTWTSRDDLLAGIWLGSHSEPIIGSGDIRYHTALMTSYLSAQQTTRQETCAIRWELWFNSTKQSLSISPCRFLYRRLFTALYKNGGFQIEFAAGVCVSFTPIGFMQGTHSHTHSH